MIYTDFNRQAYISTIYHGALGNNLFQVATLISHAEKHHIPFITGYWSHWNSTTNDYCDPPSEYTNPFFMPFAVPNAQAMYGETYTWHSMFPRLPYFNNPDNTVPGHFDAPDVDARWDYEIDTGRGGLYDPIDAGVGTQIQGYFFNKEYWHSEREVILHYLTFSETFIAEACKAISSILENETTVSLNMRYIDERLATDATEMPTILEDIENLDWVSRAVEYFPEDYIFIVTSNNIEKGIKQLEDKFPNRKFMPVSGNPGEQMAACSMCDHHIVVNSTFSFWCAYLDKNQPNGTTVYSTKFKQRHSPNCIPFKEWVELAEE